MSSYMTCAPILLGFCFGVKMWADFKRFDDIREEGRGIIGLLSGDAGIGKTLTAAVVEITGRPQYVVTAGPELGIEPSDLDQRLARLLELWDAVLLLDEAEAFLQKRSATDVKRNALVSIFLRQLVYYQGIDLGTDNKYD
ncbi:hypothetical protein JB92DRAFT_2833379 [Gautieria morchelliformis]|nr:hypothetical protein JB92DRAFT_2833379 [Gautieria morchelliformis]